MALELTTTAVVITMLALGTRQCIVWRLILQVLETLLLVLIAYDASDTENDNLAIGYNAMTTNTAGGTECCSW